MNVLTLFSCTFQLNEQRERNLSRKYNIDTHKNPGGALSTYTYGEVSPIFLGQNIVKSDIFGSKEN